MFLEINCLVISLINPLLSRNFCQKRVRLTAAVFVSPTLGTLIDMHARLFILREKSSLHALIKSLHDYSFLGKVFEKSVFCPKKVQKRRFFVTLHGYLGLHVYLILQNDHPYTLIQDPTSIKILRVCRFTL